MLQLVKQFSVTAVAISLCFAAFAAAESASPPSKTQIMIEFGQGQVRIETIGFDLSTEQIDLLKTDLLVTDELVDLVTAGVKSEIVLDGAAVDKMAQRLHQTQEQVAGDIKGLIIGHVHGRRGAPESKERTLVGERVAIGHEITVEENEHVKEVVVVGGEARIFGEVDQLIVIGGVGKIFAGAIVNQDLVNIASQIVVDDLATVRGDRVNIAFPSTRQEWRALKEMLRENSFFSVYDSWWFQLLRFAFWCILLIGVDAVIGQLFRGFQARAQVALETEKVISLVVGLMGVIALVPIILFLIITLIGIALIPVLVVVVLALGIYSYAQMARWLARMVKPLLFAKPWVQILFGLVLVYLIAAVPVLGSVVFVGLWLISWGSSLRASLQGI